MKLRTPVLLGAMLMALSAFSAPDRFARSAEVEAGGPGAPPPAPPPAAGRRAVSPVTDAMLQSPPPGEWLTWRRTLDSWGYSPLSQINTSNVGNLRLAWTRGMGPGSQQGTPLVHDGVMFLPNPSDLIQALDAGTGDVIWEYKRQWPDDLAKIFPTPTPNRNIAIYGDKIIDTSADDFVFALDSSTGKLAWETQILDFRKNPAQETAGPIIADGKIISGRGCEPRGGPDACVITAHDATTGKELWRTRTMPRAGEPGDESWKGVPEEQRLHVGTWMAPSYDAELKLIFIGTSVTSPAPKYLLGGNDLQYLYHNSTLALDVSTGKIVWYYQHVVDHWDLDHPFERLLVETAMTPDPKSVQWINPRLKPGERRKVVTGIPGKTGIVYTLDRRTGEFLWATSTIKQNVVSNIDGATGKVTVNPESLFNKIGDQRLICPSSQGGKNWPAGAYSPQTRLMYFPLQNTCATVTAALDKPSLSSLYGYRASSLLPEGRDKVGLVQAISVDTGKTAWIHEQRAATLSLVATGGGLVFGGDYGGRFSAFDQKSGKVVWQVNLGSPVTGYPISYAIGGKQYLAVSTGGNSPQSAINRLTPEIRTSTVNAVYVFTLPDR